MNLYARPPPFLEQITYWLKLTLKQKGCRFQSHPRWDWNLQNLDLRPARHYCRHLGLYDIEIVRRIVYLNLSVACNTSLTFP